MIFKKLSEILDIPLIIFPVSALFKDGGSITADSILAHIFCDSEGDNMRINDAIVIRTPIQPKSTSGVVLSETKLSIARPNSFLKS